MRSRSLVASLVVTAGLISATSAFAAESKDYGSSGRISALEGTVYGRGPYDTETSELAQNAVLRAGDEVFTDEGTFAEVELPNGTFLRLAGNTTVVVNKLDTDGVEIPSRRAPRISRAASTRRPHVSRRLPVRSTSAAARWFAPRTTRRSRASK